MKRVLRKSLLTIFCSIFAVCGLCLAATAVSNKVPVNADAAALEAEFTNDGEFTLSKYNNVVPYQIVDGSGEGLPAGYEGAVLKITTTGGMAYVNVNFSASNILTKNVESIVVRMYSSGYTAVDEFRTIASNGTTQRQYGAGSKDMSTWCDITLNADSIGDMTDASGCLAFLTIGVRVKSSATEYYIDSITVNTTEPHAATATYTAMAAGWNNLSSNSASNNILNYNV